MANRVLADLAVRISANTAEFTKEIKKTNNQLDSFSRSVKGIATTVGLAFGIREIGAFLNEVSLLAGEAEGVSVAFNKIENSKRLMLDLKEATGGAVSELNLMKRAVQFANFGLDISRLPTLLQFATIRAQQTGESVDYLVNSIVTGLGRKSVLILDNLGISAAQLSEEVAKVGDFTQAAANIIDRDLAKMGGTIDTTKSKTEEFNASLENLKVSLGNAANGTGILSLSLEGLTSNLNIAASANLDFFDKLSFLVGNEAIRTQIAIKNIALAYADAAKEAAKAERIQKFINKAYKEFNGDLEKFTEAAKNYRSSQELIAAFAERVAQEQNNQAKSIENINNLTAELTVLQKLQGEATGDNLLKINQEIDALQKKIKALKELGLAESQALSRAGRSTRTPQMSINGSVGNPFQKAFQLDKDPILENIDAIEKRYLDALSNLGKGIGSQLILQEQFANSFLQSANAAQQFGAVAGDSIAGLITKEATFAQGLARISDQIVQEYGRRAIAKIIESAAGSSKFPFVAIAAATAGVAAISGLLRSVGYRRGGSGGGGVGRGGRFASPNSYSFAQDSSGIRLQVDPIVIRGQDLYVSLTNYEKNNRNTRNG